MHDELRRLDEDLAAGRLDADSYRRRRDELLAARPAAPARAAATVATEAVGDATPVATTARRGTGAPGEGAPSMGGPGMGGPGTGGPGTGGPGEEGRDRAASHEVDGDDAGAGEADRGGPVEVDPFPPPFRWDGAPEADAPPGADVDPTGSDLPGSAPDATQVVAARRAAGEEPERTQVVRGGTGAPAGAADATQVVGRPRAPDPRLGPARSGPPVGPPERTQFVPGAALTRAGDLRSVPARRTVPPWVDERSVGPADARRPGREVFARRRGPSPAAVIGTAALVLVVLVVLALSFLLG